MLRSWMTVLIHGIPLATGGSSLNTVPSSLDLWPPYSVVPKSAPSLSTTLPAILQIRKYIERSVAPRLLARQRRLQAEHRAAAVPCLARVEAGEIAIGSRAVKRLGQRVEDEACLWVLAVA